MLDVEGFVSETNATNVFMVKGGALLTPATGSCLPGITRYVASILCICPPVLSLSVSLFPSDSSSHHSTRCRQL